MTVDWDKLRVFHAVAEAGSFTHAGDVLNLSQSAVSRQVSSLEESLRVPLFHRHARGLMLTEQGEILFKTAREVLSKLNMAEARISESRERPKGPLKVTATIAFGSIWLAPRLKEFLEDNPDIEVSLVLTDNELDLSMREADVAIRLTAPTQSDLIQRRLMTLTYHVFASPSYLQKHGMPRKPEDSGSSPTDRIRRRRAPAGTQSELATGGRAEGRDEASRFPQGQFYLCHLPRGPERHRHRRASTVS